MRILVSNDDGIYAKGISVLAEFMRAIGSVNVVAPDRNRSGASTSLTLDSPVRVKTLEDNRIAVEGTPTDSVHLAITGLLGDMPDMVVSGINEGSNLGDDVWYSGTVAAAIEGRFLGLPAIAVSLAMRGYEPQYYETAGRVTQDLVLRLLRDPLPAATILNVNVPDIPYNELQGYEVTRLGTRHIAENIIPIRDPRGHTAYWIGPAGSEQDAGEGTDFYAVSHNRVSITPLKIDLTNFQAFDQLSKWTDGLTHKATTA